MNWVDAAITATLIFFFFFSIGRPFIIEVLDLISFVLAFVFSFNYYNFPAKFFETQFKIPHGLSLVLGFMSMWFISELIFYLIVRVIIPKLPKINIPWGGILSVIPAVLRGLIFTSLFLVMVATFPIQPTIKKAVLDSKLGSEILKYSYALEKPVKGVFGGVTNDTLTFMTVEPKANEKVNLGFQTDQFSNDSVSEQKMFELVNEERTSRGIKALTWDTHLRDIARLHSADMFKRGYFSHFSPEGKNVADRALVQGVDFLVIGENLAYAPNVGAAFKGLMNSAGHRVNILSIDYHKIGIGVLDGGIYGEMFTQVFSN